MKEQQIKEELTKTVAGSHYNGWNNRTTFGYHSYNIEDINIVGQRNPKIRLETIRKSVDFEGKNVIDFGCNVGSMLHHLHEIKNGAGFDYDTKCINAANNISKILGRDNLTYKVHDFDKESYDSLRSKIKFEPDVIFVLSLGSWVKTWENLYNTCLSYDCDIILEINNVQEGASQIDFFKKRGMTVTMIMDNSKDDSTGNNRRKTYLINKK
tara:strand:- start:580 stop:1212 length:633 start_codon:yes stop_codon:yes gene_type:complete